MMRARRSVLAAAALLALGACFAMQPPVRIEPRGEEALHRNLDACALYGDVPSARTVWILRLVEAEERFEVDPVGTLRVLHERLLREGTREGLFCLAELSYLAGKRLEDKRCFLASAVYAYLYLLGEEGGPPASPYDRRFRWACDLYNRSLVRALKSTVDGGLELQPGERELPTGSLRLEVDYRGFPFPREQIELLPADEHDVVGLGFRVRDHGLGAPLVAVVQRRGEGTTGVHVQDRTSVTATLFLRLQGDLRDLQEGIDAVLELHSTYDSRSVEVQGAEVPLEADPSATIAYGLQLSDLWRLEISGLFRGRTAQRENGLILPRPFEAGRIPVVLVHGTASNPARWGELWNSLHADPLIRARVQLWLFIYTTGNPVVYSAASLRESLQDIVRQHDPEGRDVALQHMVVVGHSQGGLLAKLTAVRMDAEQVSRELLGTSLQDLGLDAQGLQVMHRCFDVEPLPFVDRLVFISTPHRGSFLAGTWFANLLAKLIAVPGEVENVAQRIVSRVPAERLPPGLQSRMPTSLDNMNPSNPFLRFLAEVPIDPGVHAHSIIAIGRAQDPVGADDGVVAYQSAHLEEAESEVLVPSKHSSQGHPRTIIELRRILREHIQAVDALCAPQ